MENDDEERIQCKATSTSTTELHSAYTALIDQLKALVITESSDVSGMKCTAIFHTAKYVVFDGTCRQRYSVNDV